MFSFKITGTVDGLRTSTDGSQKYIDIRCDKLAGVQPQKGEDVSPVFQVTLPASLVPKGIPFDAHVEVTGTGYLGLRPWANPAKGGKQQTIENHRFVGTSIKVA